jgi:hypothetical protein
MTREVMIITDSKFYCVFSDFVKKMLRLIKIFTNTWVLSQREFLLLQGKFAMSGNVLVVTTGGC